LRSSSRSATASTSPRWSTDTTVTGSRYSSSTVTSRRFARGTTTRVTPASAAASIPGVTPPTGSTSPRTDSEPVIATDWSTATPSSAETTAVATVTDAESPSTPPAPAPTNWMWTSIRARSVRE
jgi:hypothetical protein